MRALAIPFLFSCLALTGCAGDDADGDSADASDGAAPAADLGAADLTADQQEQMAMIAELQTIDQRLGPMRDQVFQDPAFQVRQQALVARIEEEVEKMSPGSREKRARFDSLVTEYGVAEGAGDDERVQSLGGVLQALESELRQAQTEAMESPALKEALDSFREDLFDKVRLLDPAADSLIKRGEELNAKLTATTGGAGG